MTKFEQFFKDQSNILKAQSESTANVEHRASIGSNREAFIKEFIKKVFPSKFVVGSGEIFDSEDHLSKQCDVIIYDELLPVFDYSSTQQFIAEGVFSHIEVKSNLSSEELKKSLEVTKSVKVINKNIKPVMTMGSLSKKVFSCVFAYKGISKEAAKSVLDQYYTAETDINDKIDAICVLGEYVIVKQKASDSTDKLVGFETKEASLSIFFTQLYQSMFKNWIAEPDLMQYIKNTRFQTF